MAPSKRKQKHNHLHAVTSHLARPSPAGVANRSSQDTSRSVSESIEHLRRTQTPQLDASPNQLYRLSSQESTLVLHPARRRQAGPPPPKSWTISTDETPAGRTHDKTVRRPSRLKSFPGTSWPEGGTLKHQTLKAMARNLHAHIDYDHTYLALLPTEIKQQWLSYIAYYGPDTGISLLGIRALFQGDAGNHEGDRDVTRLDLSGSLGRGLSLKLLHKYRTRDFKASKQSLNRIEHLPESWDEDPTASRTLPLPLMAFPRLTHLSLSRPAANVSWLDLLNLSQCLGSITHLSLDFWPRPRIQGHSLSLDSSQATCQSAREMEEMEAAHVLHLLSRNTKELAWLSLSGCQSWWSALRPYRARNELQEGMYRHSNAALCNAITSRAPIGRERAWARGNARRYDQADNEWTSVSSASKSKIELDWTESWSRLRNMILDQTCMPERLHRADLKYLQSARQAAHGNFADQDGLLRLGDREPETYTIIEPEANAERSVEASLRRREWLRTEHKTYLLAGAINGDRKGAGAPTVRFDFGWEPEKLFELGHDDQQLVSTEFGD